MTIDLLRLGLAVLTCYRLAQLLPYDTGPFFVFDRIRAFTDKRRIQQQATGKLRGAWASLDEMIRCPFCQGFWLAIPCLFLVLYPSRYGDLLLGWLGIAGGQAYLQERRL